MKKPSLLLSIASSLILALMLSVSPTGARADDARDKSVKDLAQLFSAAGITASGEKVDARKPFRSLKIQSPYCDKANYEFYSSGSDDLGDVHFNWVAADGYNAEGPLTLSTSFIDNLTVSLPIVGPLGALLWEETACLRGNGLCAFLKLPSARRQAMIATRNAIQGAVRQFERGDKARAADTIRQIAGICQGKRMKLFYPTREEAAGTQQASTSTASGKTDSANLSDGSSAAGAKPAK